MKQKKTRRSHAIKAELKKRGLTMTRGTDNKGKRCYLVGDKSYLTLDEVQNAYKID